MGQHDHRLRDRRQRLPPLAQEVAEQALLQVVNVVGPLGDVIVEVLKGLRVAAERAAHRILRPPVLVADGAGEFLLELRVVKHRQMGLEDGRVLVSEFGPDRIAVSLDLVSRLGHGRGEPGEFGVDGTPFDESPRNAEALAIKNECFADRDAG